MTAAYDLFLREFNATGRESMEGVSIYNLADLSERERPLVHQLLIKAFQQRNERAPRPLAFIDSTPATRQLLVHEVQAHAANQPVDEFLLACAYALLTLTDHTGALDILERKVRDNDDLWLCGLAMEGLIRSVPATNASARLARMVRIDPEGELRLAAADALLQRHGWMLEDANPARAGQALALFQTLAGAQDADRDAALLKILKTPVEGWPRP